MKEGTTGVLGHQPEQFHCIHTISVLILQVKTHKIIVHGLNTDVPPSLQNLILGNIKVGHFYFSVSLLEAREHPIPSHPAGYVSTSVLGTQTNRTRD